MYEEVHNHNLRRCVKYFDLCRRRLSSSKWNLEIGLSTETVSFVGIWRIDADSCKFNSITNTKYAVM